MVSLAGLSAVYPGELQAEGQGQQNDMRALQLKDAKGVQQGQADFAKGLMQALVPGAQAGGPPPPPQQMPPQAPPPGQPSQPMQPPQPPPQQPMGPAAGGAQAPQRGMPVGAPPGGAQAQGGPPPGGAPPQGDGLPPQAQQLAGKVDLRSAVQNIIKANPGIQQDPQRLYYALKAGEWILNDQSKQQLAEMRQQMQQENLAQRGANLDERARHNEETEGRLRDAEKAKQDRFNTREARLEAKQTIQQDQNVQKLALQQKGLEYKIASGDKATTMKMWRDKADDKRKAALAAASIYSVNNSLDDKQKAKLMKDVNDSAEEEIANMRNLQGSSTPTGGTVPPGGGKTSDRVGDQPKPIPPDIRGQFDEALKQGKPRDKLIEKLKSAGYMTDGL